MSTFSLPTRHEHLTDFDKYERSGFVLRCFSEKVERRAIQRNSVTGKRHFSQKNPSVKRYVRSGKKCKDTCSKINLQTAWPAEVKSDYHRSQSFRSVEEKNYWVGNLPSLLNDTWITATSAVDRTSSTKKNGHVSKDERRSLHQTSEVAETSSYRGTKKRGHFKEGLINMYDFIGRQNIDTVELSESSIVNSVLEMEEAPIDSYETQILLESNMASDEDIFVSTGRFFDTVDGDLISILDDVESLADNNLQKLSQEDTEKMDEEKVDKNTSKKNESEMKRALTIIRSCQTTDLIGESPDEELTNITTDVADYKSGIKQAVEESIREKTIHPIVKQELKFKLQLDRVTRGEEELLLEPDEPIQYKLREDEIKKKNARREQNRRSAVKARDRQRENVKMLTETINTKALENTRLMTEKRALADEKADLVKRLKEHLTYCTDKNLKEFTGEVLRPSYRCNVTCVCL